MVTLQKTKEENITKNKPNLRENYAKINIKEDKTGNQ